MGHKGFKVTPDSSRFQFLGIPPKGELALQIYAAGRWHGFPISRDPPEGGTVAIHMPMTLSRGFQFLGIPPKGEHEPTRTKGGAMNAPFPISRDPPEGGTPINIDDIKLLVLLFPISRDPPEGGTSFAEKRYEVYKKVSNF